MTEADENNFYRLIAFLVDVSPNNCEALGPAEEHWFHNLREIRNEIVHKAEVKSITDNNFSKYWQKLEGVVVGIASKVDNDYKLQVTSEVEYLLSRQILSDDKLKVCTVLHEWWSKMCCEMEKSQQEYHEQFEKRLQSIEGSIETSDGNLQEMRGDFMKK
ncbi:unnamed protein product [Mytilus edulis]|uniref:DZIP3-like HEPN domain-containing protein n=1 Tax=Mytilus edulis TaxID=6550 RepID=A0A8S3QWT1_MYTED|nr:unnamed protein product [Mytilus edulis]